MPGSDLLIFLYLLKNFSEALTQAGKGLIIISPTLSDCSLLIHDLLLFQKPVTALTGFLFV